jgi:general secretion pathway protein A
MYRDFYNMQEAPFNVTPDPRFLFFTYEHREAYDALKYGIEQRKGFITLTGEVGCGKTTVCRAVLADLPQDTRTALILNPCLTETQLIRAILVDLGLKPRGNDRLSYIEQLNEFLIECLQKNENVAIVIDEAQDLDPQVMEQVRLLSNLETDQHKLMQLILIGQPELEKRLRHREWRQLRQRIMVHCNLRPLSFEEVRQYIRFRLQAAQANPKLRFDNSALRCIYRRSRGIPRIINMICDRALLAGYVTGKFILSAKEVKKAVKEMETMLV